MTLPAGTKLGPYEIIAPLGAGGMGEVYRARDPQLGRDVAIKVLPSFFSRDPDRLRRFEQEARAAAALNHPNILAVYQMGTFEGAPYLVSELLEGSTLRDQMLRGPLSIRKAVDYGIQTARGLAAAHEKGIVHRDLKPENLFVTKDGRIKILDFGLAKLLPTRHTSEVGTPTLSDGTEPGVVLGTVGYMAPEQVRGHSTDDRADLFAFGAILFEMLTGKRAFHKATSAETMSAILNEEPPAISQILPAVPPALQRVVQRCLEKSPEQRFHSASDLAFALEALSDAGTAPTGALAEAKSRTSWAWIAGAAVAVAVAVALAVWFSRSPAVPVVESVVQLTNDGQSKTSNLETDGARIYFNEGPSGSLRIAQVSVNGGQTGEVPTKLVNAQIAGLTADGSALLALTGAPYPTRLTMWLVPLPAGEARRLGDTDVTDANLFPDGRILYAISSEIYVAEKDGGNPHKLEEASKAGSTARLSFDGLPSISADEKRFVGSATDNSDHSRVFYETASDGAGLHRVLKAGQGLPADICCPIWTEDGKYLLFRGRSEGRVDIWAVSSQKRFLGGAPAPVQLTNGPVSYSAHLASRDGKQIFAIGAQRRGELVHYDSKAQDFVSYLGGISALDPTFSRDGKWVAYYSYPEHTLWRSRADGSDRLQLTYPPLIVTYPRISPDGTQVAFSTLNGTAYVISMNGGTPKKVLDNAAAPDWSPDGNLLAVTSGGPSFLSRIVDLRNGSVSVLPDSQGTIGPWFVTPDTLIAVANDQTKFALFDFKTRKWTELISNPDRFINWETSHDCKYFFYSTGGNNPTIFRMRVADHVVEKIASLKDLHVVDDPYVSIQLSVGADDSPVVTRDIGTQEVYAITVKWP
jgi:eukaryotic-like serine/threonine-protein kinase